VLIDFGLLVPQELMDYFPLGIVNSHFSLLPEWRGADPITFSILSGQQTTGISLMILAANIDEGPLLAQSSSVIPATATTPSLTETLINLSDKTLASVLPNYIAGKIKPYPQTLDHPVTYSRKLYKNDGVIDWHKPAQQLEREIRAFIEWPKSQTKFGDVDITITQAHVAPYNGKPGGTAVYNKLPVVYCGEQALAIDKLKPASRSEMTGEAFLNGYGRAFKV
jgi:methionyl-tRNA formyltransferase